MCAKTGTAQNFRIIRGKRIELNEKFLNDTMRAESVKKIEELSQKDLMPSILAVEQFIFDSTRAEEWAKRYKDSTQLRKYLKRSYTQPKKDSVPPPRTAFLKKEDMILPEKQLFAKMKRSRV